MSRPYVITFHFGHLSEFACLTGYSAVYFHRATKMVLSILAWQVQYCTILRKWLPAIRRKTPKGRFRETERRSSRCFKSRQKEDRDTTLQCYAWFRVPLLDRALVLVLLCSKSGSDYVGRRGWKPTAWHGLYSVHRTLQHGWSALKPPVLYHWRCRSFYGTQHCSEQLWTCKSNDDLRLTTSWAILFANWMQARVSGAVYRCPGWQCIRGNGGCILKFSKNIAAC